MRSNTAMIFSGHREQGTKNTSLPMRIVSKKEIEHVYCLKIDVFERENSDSQESSSNDKGFQRINCYEYMSHWARHLV